MINVSLAGITLLLLTGCMSSKKDKSSMSEPEDRPFIAPVFEPAAETFFSITGGILKFDSQGPTYSEEERGQFANVNGIRMYYEITGSGEPLFLLHGGFYNMDYWAAYQVPEFSKNYKVIAVDSRGHGRTNDGHGPINYEIMTEDVLQLMKYLEIDKAHFVGWSDGGIVALNMAIAHPERVDKLVLDGVSTRGKGAVSYLDELGMSSDNLLYLFTTLACSETYKKINPEPAHWPEFVAKMQTMWSGDCYVIHPVDQECMAPLRDIKSKTLVLVGEDDLILPAHTQEIKDRIPDSSLVVIPDADHFVAREQPEDFNRAVLDFLSSN